MTLVLQVIRLKGVPGKVRFNGLGLLIKRVASPVLHTLKSLGGPASCESQGMASAPSTASR